MPSPTYLQRIQQVLGEVAKEDKTSISWDTLLFRVGSLSTVSQTPSPSISRRCAENALRREIFAHRVLKICRGDVTTVTLTDKGVQFYRAWGQIVVYDLDDPRFQRMSTAEVKRQSKTLRDVLRDIRDTFLEYKPDVGDHQDVSHLPTAVSELLCSVQNLEDDNIAMELEWHDEEKKKQVIHRRLLAVSPAGDSAPKPM